MKNLLNVISLTLIIIFSGQAVADSCTGQIEGYLAGLKVGATSIATNEADAKNAMKQIKNIQTMRQRLPDCKVREHIAILKQSDLAIERAIKSINDSGAPR